MKKIKDSYVKNNLPVSFLFTFILIVMSPVIVRADDVQLDFENGELHGFYGGATAPGLENDTARAYEGSGSMKITIDGAGQYDVQKDSLGTIAPGTPVEFYYFVPAGMSVSLQPFILDGSWGWSSTWVDKSSNITDTWTKVSLMIPESAIMPINRFGIQVFAEQAGSLWIDGIRWITEVSVDKTGLARLIAEATTLMEGAVEGDDYGEYEPGSTTLFQAALDSATAIYENPGSSRAEVDDATMTLALAITAFQAAQRIVQPPARLTVETTAENLFFLQWEPSPDGGLHAVKRALQIGGPYTILVSGSDFSSYADSTIEPGITYYYVITTTVGGYESAPSNEVNTKLLGPYQLKDIPVFKDNLPGCWAGGDTGSEYSYENSCLEVTGSWQVPVDTEVIYNNLPSLRLNVVRDGTWWVALLAGPGWITYDIEEYYENGFLEFTIKGSKGGESFNLGLFDKVPGRDPLESGTEQTIRNFITITKEWQHVAIPLQSLVNPGEGFDLSSTTYLRFGKDYGVSGQVFTVWINDIKISSPDNEKNYPFIKVNQVGYTPRSGKYALVSCFDGVLDLSEDTVFHVISASTGKAVYKGTLQKVSDYDTRVSGEEVFKADFTKLRKCGDYYITLPDMDIPASYTFTIGKGIFDSMLIDVSRYYYFQRANMPLEPEYAMEYARDDFTPGDFAAPLKSDPGGTLRDVSGGWYDAGDFGKYTNAGAMAVSDLMWAYELFPDEFTDNQFAIPESGNGIPDILDEIRYELEFLLKLQDTDGGFYHRVFPGDKEDETHTRYIDDQLGQEGNIKPTSHTGSAAGALAHASLVYASIDPDFSALLLDAAVKGWEYLKDHPDTVSSIPGPYYDNDDADDRFFAAAALYKATGNEEYGLYIREHYKAFSGLFDDPQNAHGCGFPALTGFFHYIGSGSVDPALNEWFIEKFARWRGVQLGRGYNNTWRNTLRYYDYYWGSNSPVLCTSMDLVIGSKLTGTYNSQVINVVRSNLNYILGVNPMSFSYVSGYGENSLKNVYSGIYNEDGLPDIPPGYMAGGANMYEGSWFSRFNGKCYNDVNTEWTTNEHTIYWNSGLVFSTALVSAEEKKTSGNILLVLALPVDILIETGESTAITLKAVMDDGTAGDLTGAEVSYELCNPAVADISGDGILTGKQRGIALVNINVTYGAEEYRTKTIVLIK
ncbi:MAG: glycoside hydrolase family 9 protein [Spirochaetales bacterium]|nr:glycoside hydrolase family 9 protein [Spirochaetales bacterium]